MTWFKTLRDLILPQPRSRSCLCMIVSEQEGAEIWLDDQKTEHLTPKAVNIPKGKEVKVTIKLIGHKDHVAYIRSFHNLTYYHCNLERIPLRLISNEVYHSASV